MKKLFDTNPESLIFAALIKVVQRIAIGVRSKSVSNTNISLSCDELINSIDFITL